MAALHFRSILCAVDFSVHSRQALQYAAAAAKRFRGKVTVLFVNDPLLLAAARQSYGDKRQVVEQSRVELARFARQAVRGSEQMTSVVAVGSPASQILATAKRLRSDLIVIGTQGLSGVQKLVFGSTTEQVLRRTTIPVLAVPPQTTRRNRSHRPLAVDAIIVPIDLAGEWASDAVRGAVIARMFNVPIRLVHVLRPVQTPTWIRRIGIPSERQRIAKATRALEHLTRQLGAGVRASCSVVLGEPAHEIARLTQRGSPLLVMSLRGTGGIWGRRGAIAYHVLTHSATPVLGLPRRQLGGPLATRLRRSVNETLIARDRIEMAGIDALLSAGSGETRLKR
ncbi:MAG TPA: universal stress protein [Vicinamibacterales bacterium]|jgi:nucleotide-binding universal stress UspA family protein|nr:universal stress protein [Vicinamibacterales bacterium]